MRKKGYLISIEGIDGSGKTTQSKLLTGKLKERGYDAIYTREPTNGPIGTIIKREVLRRGKRPPPVVEAVLFAADRLNHVEKEIKPALEKGKVIICDRYVHSSLAYQGSAGISLKWIRKINKFAPKPDLAIYLDVKPEIGLSRVRKEKTVMDELEIQKLVRKMYLKLVEEGELVIVDGERSVDEVFNEVFKIVIKILE